MQINAVTFRTSDLSETKMVIGNALPAISLLGFT